MMPPSPRSHVGSAPAYLPAQRQIAAKQRAVVTAAAEASAKVRE
jgi:hypothetical protein